MVTATPVFLDPTIDCRFGGTIASQVVSNEAKQLWTAPNGRYCTLTPITASAPFLVTVFDANGTLKQRSFDNHNDAAEFAIAEMREALAPPRNPSKD